MTYAEMKTKKQQSRDRESLAFRMRFAVLAALIGVLIAWLAPSPPAQSQILPPLCSPAGEPGTNACGDVGVSCYTDAPCNGTSGSLTWWCCYESPTNNCRQWKGRWKCCNGVWKRDCERINKNWQQNNCETNGYWAGHCY